MRDCECAENCYLQEIAKLSDELAAARKFGGDDPAAWLGPDRLTVTLAEQGAGRHATVSGAGVWDAKLKDLHV